MDTPKTPRQLAEDFFERFTRAIMTPNGEFDRIKEFQKVIETAIKEDRKKYRAQFRARERKKNV